jgi:hypothetical protein
MKSVAVILLLVAVCTGCSYRTKYPYTIRDFSSSLQPYILNALSIGMPAYDSSLGYLRGHATTRELKKLSISEHPMLRMLALRILINRKGIDHFTIIMNHLDDTATVATDEGEWGIGMKRVSDFMLERARWETVEKRNKTIEKVLLEHNYLRAAYTIIPKLEANERYYNSILQMAKRADRNYEMETEYALYGLAKFKKKEDVYLIKEIMRTNSYWLERYSFKLMEEFPDDAYLEILKYYMNHGMWKDIYDNNYSSRPGYFFNALASYKNEKAAQLLAIVMKYLPTLKPRKLETWHFKDELYYAIWNNKCNAYSKMIPVVKPAVEKLLKNTLELKVDPIKLPEDDEKEKFSWYF